MKRTKLLAAALAATMLLTLTACDQVKLARRTARLMYGSATALRVGVDLKTNLRASGILTEEGNRAIAQGLLDAVRPALEITDTAECFIKYDGPTKQALLTAADDAIRALSRLAAAGTLHIHNPARQVEFGLWLAGASATVAALRAALDNLKVNNGPIGGGAVIITPFPDDIRELCAAASVSLRATRTQLENELGIIRLDMTPA